MILALNAAVVTAIVEHANATASALQTVLEMFALGSIVAAAAFASGALVAALIAPL